MMVLQQWTGWSKSRKEELQLPLLQQLVLGTFQQKMVSQQTKLKGITLIL